MGRNRLSSQISHFLAYALLGCIIPTCCCGCRRGMDTATPKPEAYPRINIPDSSFTTISVDGIPLHINSDAAFTSTTHDDGEWIDIHYPGWDNVVIHLTLSRPAHAHIPAMLHNRRQRMSLNAGNTDAEILSFRSAEGWECEMMLSPEAISTPVQILATNGHRMLSGALHMNMDAKTPPDSVAPIVSAARRDLLTMMKHL